MYEMTSDTYMIYIHSSEHPRTINTPMTARTYFTVFYVQGKEAFVTKLNELVKKGEWVTEVRHGYWGKYVNYWEYITQ